VVGCKRQSFCETSIFSGLTLAFHFMICILGT
jgi:hypothetical protein